MNVLVLAADALVEARRVALRASPAAEVLRSNRREDILLEGIQ